jgi:hypothetical protein
MVVQDNCYSSITKPRQTLYLTARSQFSSVAKTCRTNQKLHSAAGVVLRLPIHECFNNPITDLERYLESLGGTGNCRH